MEEEDNKIMGLRGRPKAYATLEELSKKIIEYFQFCDSQKKEIFNDRGLLTKIIYKPYTVSGLAVFLGIHIDTLHEYGKKDHDFSETVRFAKDIIANWTEEKAASGETNHQFAIFSLKNNFGWADRQHIETEQNINQNIMQISPATLEANNKVKKERKKLDA